MKVVFMGTPDIAAGILRTLIDSKHEVAAVVTQPDRPKGRNKEIEFSPVKKCALDAGIPVYQPEKASSAEFEEELRRIAPEIIVVAAYGQILKNNILELPEHGCINVHASLLPKYRGSSPIQWAIINGDAETGVTIMHMDAGIDTGDIILSDRLTIAPDETAGTLHDRLSELGGPVLLRAMEQIENGTAVRTKQDDSQASHVSMLKKTMGELDFSHPAAVLERLIRGLIPWPGAYTYLDGKTLKIWKTAVADIEGRPDGHPGRVTIEGRKRLFVETGDKNLEILELQLEGKKRMATEEFLKGCNIETGCFLGK